MFTIFSCSIHVTVTSQNGVTSFHLHLVCGGVIYTPKIILFFIFVALKWLKTSIEILK